MPSMLSDKLLGSLIKQIINNPTEPLIGSDIIIIECGCKKQIKLTFRDLHRRWSGEQSYRCKSCDVKTYANDQQKLEKFKKTLSAISNTEEYRLKCSENGKKAWDDPEFRKRLSIAVTADNISNPKKAQSRAIALAALQAKPWYLEHLNKIRGIANDVTRSTIDEFINHANIVHDCEYTYELSEYVNNTTNICITCPKHGEFWQTPHNHLQGKGCGKCKTTISNAHQVIIDMLPDIEIINNDREVICPYEIDALIRSHNIGIEIHGEYWHGLKHNTIDKNDRLKKLHARKADMAESVGIKLYQFWEREILNNYGLVQSMLMNAIGRSKRIYARSCEVLHVNNNTVREFYESSHLNGHKNASVNYILSDDNGIACGLNFSKHNMYQWEITRFACRRHTTVVGGFARLLKRFVNDYGPNTIMTFADRRISQGGLYRNNGFLHIETTRPNYFYYKNGNTLSRQQCQKQKLPKIIGSSYDSSTTEVMNMLSAGYVQVFDAGHLKFIKKFQ